MGTAVPDPARVGSVNASARPRAVFTIVQNEPLFLPLWIDYYRRWFDPGDVYVLDHDSRDGSISRIAGACEVVPVHRTKSFDHDWLRSTVAAFQRFLLQSYETVLFAEVDELVVADPASYGGLDDYIGRLERPAARCTGFNVVQQPDELPLDFARPILRQRRCWHRAPLYSKRLLARMPLDWGRGFHDETSAPPDPPDPNLVLLHLHRVDYASCLARHRAAAARDWNERDLVTNAGWQNRVTDPSLFEEWFRRGSELGSLEPEPIPERFRSVL